MVEKAQGRKPFKPKDLFCPEAPVRGFQQTVLLENSVVLVSSTASERSWGHGVLNSESLA